MLFSFLVGLCLLAFQIANAAYTDPHCQGKQVIVHLFEWKWKDVADECERFLGLKQFCGVQVSPPNEHVIVTSPMRPWWERYQPVSYKLQSRSGTEEQFKDMVDRCKNVGVRIFVDAVVNHMAGLGRSGNGTAGSLFDSDKFDFPGVPYRREHFNSIQKNKCPSGDGGVNDYSDPKNVRNCNLIGLTDLNQELEYVREKIVGYFNHLIDIGVAGFRLDASKHMWPSDLQVIEKRVKDLPEGGRPFFIHEVIDQDDGAVRVNEYTSLGYVTEFRYCQKIAFGIHDFGQLHDLYDPGWKMTDPDHAFVFVDNHDNQRGHGGGGNLITHKTPRDYKMAVAFTLAYNYGFTRVMSSYYFGNDNDQGPPHNADYSAKEVVIQPDGSCGNGWICEHRWNPIANMAAFRNAVVGTDINHWENENDEVTFSRGQKGFFAMAKQGHMDKIVSTGLPAGEYCDLISDCKKKVTVDGAGNAHIVIDNTEEPILAFIVEGPTAPTDANKTHNFGFTTASPSIQVPNSQSTIGSTTEAFVTHEIDTFSNWTRTVILIDVAISFGQDLFIDGGIDHNHRQGCTDDPAKSNCAIPIRSRDLGDDQHLEAYNAWRVGDNYLDWKGAETSQQSFRGKAPYGTPAVWTTNNHNRKEYNALNTYGPNYWLIDVDMDCSKSEHGWFEFKYRVDGRWEGDVHDSSCKLGKQPPYVSNNHWAICGAKNVYHNGHCAISPLN